MYTTASKLSRSTGINVDDIRRVVQVFLPDRNSRGIRDLIQGAVNVVHDAIMRISWGKKQEDQVLDSALVANQINNGLEDVSDCDRRSLGLAREQLVDMSVQDAGFARKIADALGGKK